MLLLKLDRRQVSQAHMRAHAVVVTPPDLDDNRGLASGTEPLHAKAFVAEFAIERLICPVHAVATTPTQRLEMYFARLPSRISLPRKGVRVDLRNDLFEDCTAFTLHYGLHTRQVT